MSLYLLKKSTVFFQVFFASFELVCQLKFLFKVWVEQTKSFLPGNTRVCCYLNLTNLFFRKFCKCVHFILIANLEFIFLEVKLKSHLFHDNNNNIKISDEVNINYSNFTVSTKIKIEHYFFFRTAILEDIKRRKNSTKLIRKERKQIA